LSAEAHLFVANHVVPADAAWRGDSDMVKRTYSFTHHFTSTTYGSISPVRVRMKDERKASVFTSSLIPHPSSFILALLRLWTVATIFKARRTLAPTERIWSRIWTWIDSQTDERVVILVANRHLSGWMRLQIQIHPCHIVPDIA